MARIPQQAIRTHSRRRMTMIGRMTLWYSYALNFPRRRSADFQMSPARLSSLGLLSERACWSCCLSSDTNEYLREAEHRTTVGQYPKLGAFSLPPDARVARRMFIDYMRLAGCGGAVHNAVAVPCAVSRPGIPVRSTNQGYGCARNQRRLRRGWRRGEDTGEVVRSSSHKRP